MPNSSYRKSCTIGDLVLYLLDTNHCSFILEGEPSVIETLQSHAAETVSTTVITAGELQFMVQNSRQRDSNSIRVRTFLRRIHVYPIDLEIATLYGEFKAELIQFYGPKEREKRKRIRLSEIGVSENDLWIAATAIQHELIVVSADRDFQRMQQVRAFGLESWA
jgi:tRNA(fMet)-specific endonuclease VapC